MATHKEWHRTIAETSYLISTSPSALSHAFIQGAFDSDQMYWAKSVSSSALQTMLNHSFNFGLYMEKAQIGYARMVTDHVTLAYLTDVYVDPAYQGKGLGKWLVQCVKESIEGIPELRRCLLITGGGNHGAQGLYEKVMGMKVIDPNDDGMVAMQGTKGDLLGVTDGIPGSRNS
ncbi:acetyltransferase [Lophium mytilinum]|uniref:Acetyltransferase n=1 Tax=Lophium mytilinum TaxID=390894 RepID=A0A6A6QRY8_9PEZI|nr:acetyltransferase [Lophium mytilinum]